MRTLGVLRRRLNLFVPHTEIGLSWTTPDDSRTFDARNSESARGTTIETHNEKLSVAGQAHSRHRPLINRSLNHLHIGRYPLRILIGFDN